MKKLYIFSVIAFILGITTSTYALTAPTAADIDCDGINDAWEVEYGFSLASNTSPGSADADSDGFSDRDEGLFGSNPNSGSSMPQPNAPVISEGTITISAPAFIGNRYLIKDSSSMFGPFVTIETANAMSTIITRDFIYPNESGRNFYTIVGAPVTCTGTDTDHDETVDAIDNDDDNDEVTDEDDAFPLDETESVDTDEDEAGDNADTDDDNDGLSDIEEETRGTNPRFGDSDDDGIGDVADNCGMMSNSDQLNTDGDAQGNLCDNDDDNDGVVDGEDPAPTDRCNPHTCNTIPPVVGGGVILNPGGPSTTSGGGGSPTPPSSNTGSNNDDGGELICRWPELRGAWYRQCAMSTNMSSSADFAENIACEGFIGTRNNYNFASKVSRFDVAQVAVKMSKKNTQFINYNFSDIGVGYTPLISDAVRYNIINPLRPKFNGERSATRAEAHAMVMHAVCMVDNVRGDHTSWRERIFETAKENGLVTGSWDTFDPQTPMTTAELYRLSARAADWAEKTGGCNPKPASCIAE